MRNIQIACVSWKTKDFPHFTRYCYYRSYILVIWDMWAFIEKAECQRTDAFELWYWRRLLRVPWTARRSNQSILKEISPEYSLEGLMLKLKLQYFGHLMWRTDSLEKTLIWERSKVGGEEDGRGWDGWMSSPTQWIWNWVSSGSWWWAGKSGVLQSMGSQRIGQDWEAELNWSLSTVEKFRQFSVALNRCRLLVSILY